MLETLWATRGLRVRLDLRDVEIGSACVVSLGEDCEHLWMHARHRHGDGSVTERGGRRHDGWTETGQLIQRMSGVCESSQRVQ